MFPTAKKSKHAVSIAATGGCALLFSSCAGDPTRGGIFWSEPKAKHRLVALRGELAEEQTLLAKAQRERNQSRKVLDRDISSVRNEIASAKRQDASVSRDLVRIENERENLARSDADSETEIQREREKYAALQNEVEQLRKKNEALQSGF